LISSKERKIALMRREREILTGEDQGGEKRKREKGKRE
jgi:hypothetical protein